MRIRNMKNYNTQITEKMVTDDAIDCGANTKVKMSPYAEDSGYHFEESETFQKIIANPENKILVRLAAVLYTDCKNWLADCENSDINSKTQVIDLLNKGTNIFNRGNLFKNLFIMNEKYDWKNAIYYYDESNSIDDLQSDIEFISDDIQDIIDYILYLGLKRPDVYLAIEVAEAYRN